MYVNPFQLSMETVIATSTMLGHSLEDRSRIREAQDHTLVQVLQACSSRTLRNAEQKSLFCVAPLDILVSEVDGVKQFHVIEINGTGIGGLTNLSGEAVSSVLEALLESAATLAEPAPVVLVASSGKESDEAPRLNKLVHEKILYAEALKRGFEQSGRNPVVTTMTRLTQDSAFFHNDRPTIVVGYMKEFLDHLRLRSDGRLTLFDRVVSAGVNDRFCMNVLTKFNHAVDLNHFQIMNRCFLAGSDKGVAYRLMNDYANRHGSRFIPREIPFARVGDRATLIATVLDWVRRGRTAVIKPQGTGLGHGIEFFLDRVESETDITARIDASIRLTEHYYGIEGGAFPYTVCEFIDTCAIKERSHSLFGHKYELRVVVYRDGMKLRAFPSIVKISCAADNPEQRDRQSLINNITASSEVTQTAGVEYMLPLSNRETLALLDLRAEHLKELCSYCTGLVGHILDRVQTRPEWFGLPPTRSPRETPPLSLPILQAA